MSAGSALVTMFNIAPWGGLHENVLYSCLGLKGRDWDITVACKSGPLVHRLADEGIDVHVVADWTDWANDAKVLARRRWDVIHSHPFASRQLALSVAETTGAPIISTFHGMYLDGVSAWADRVTTFMAVSPAHAKMLIDSEAMDPSRIVVLPNGVRDELLTNPMTSLSEKTAAGWARVVVASRIDSDKSAALFRCIETICDALSHIVNGPDWTIQLAGSGSELARTTDFLRQQVSKAANLRFEALGWVDSERVPDLMRGAVLVSLLVEVPPRASQLERQRCRSAAKASTDFSTDRISPSDFGRTSENTHWRTDGSPRLHMTFRSCSVTLRITLACRLREGTQSELASFSRTQTVP